jgi:hypothetical protein
MIEQVKVPGRLARLSVIPSQNGMILDIQTLNVKQFSITMNSTTAPPTIIRIDMEEVALPHSSHQSASSILIFSQQQGSGGWEVMFIEIKNKNDPLLT